MVGPLQQGHPVAPFGGHPGRLHAPRSAPDHHHVAGWGSGRRLGPTLVAQLSVHRAHRSRRPEVLGYANKAVDARAHQVGATLGQPVREVRVGQQLAAHGDQIGAPVGQDPLTVVGPDAPDGDDRDVHGGLHRPGQLLVLARTPRQWPFGKSRAASDRRVGGDVDGVGTGGGGPSGVPGREVGRDPALEGVIPTVEADQDGEAGTTTRSDSLHDLDQ